MLLQPDHGRWQRRPVRASVAPALSPWLTDPASLTARIRARCRQFEVRLLRQGLGPALPDEAGVFGLRVGALLWVREVLLIADGEAVVFARSLLPRQHVRGAWNLFHGFGAQPLGAALFVDPAIARGALSCVRLDRRDARYHRAGRALRQHAPAAALGLALWGRRSLFFRHRRSLMVSEFFLPAISGLPARPLNSRLSSL